MPYFERKHQRPVLSIAFLMNCCGKFAVGFLTESNRAHFTCTLSTENQIMSVLHLETQFFPVTNQPKHDDCLGQRSEL